MYLTHLSLTNFRNYARLDLDIPRGAILLVGDNAQGKTSLLEAIYFLSTFVSFQADNDRQLINFLACKDAVAVARIVADFQCENGAHRIEARIIQELNTSNHASHLRKEVLFDGVKLKVSEVVGKFNTVLFLPQMLLVVEGSPEERRRYLNLVLAQVMPGYSSVLVEYSRILSQRNALLKQLGERGGDLSQLDYWDEQLTTNGAVLIQARIHGIQEVDHLAAVVHRELTRGDEILRLSYQPSYDPLPQRQNQFSLLLDAYADRSGISLEQIQDGFRKRLQERRAEETMRGVTVIGPHRDEMRFVSNGLDLGVYGSRGQIRTAMLALKLAEVAWIKQKTGQQPVLLLDEVLAELDSQRRMDLLTSLVESEQVILSTTDPDLYQKDFIEKALLWRVQAGRIIQEGEILK